MASMASMFKCFSCCSGLQVNPMLAPVGNYTTNIVVRDALDSEALSEMVLPLTFNVLPRTKLVLFPQEVYHQY